MSNLPFPALDLFERTLDLVCIVDKSGWFKKVNPAVLETLGYTEEELFARPVSALIHPDDVKITAIKRKRLLASEPLHNFQNRYLSKSGEVVWLDWTSVYIPEQEVVFAIAKNITKQKQVQMEIEENYQKYKTLAAHFKQHVEKDRQYFATELHEELAQIATVIKMDVEWMATEQRPGEELYNKRIHHALSTVELLINKIRRLSYSMNPARVQELGLDAVLRSLCQEFSSVTGIRCLYESNFDESSLNDEVQLDLLRICQEALLNVMQHAQATEVKILLEEKNNRIELHVVDNGKGFEKERGQSFGMRNMQRRAASIDGKLEIKSNQSKGTFVSVSVATSARRTSKSKPRK